MKKIRILVWVLFFIAVLFIFTKSSPAMNDPELIQWRATTFNTFVSSTYQAVFGRLPNQNDWNFARQYRQKLRLFWALIGSQEYRNRYGYLTKKYFVYWKTRPIDTINGRKLCHCYYYAEFSGGYMPSMQYTGVSIPPGKLTKDVARSLVLACAAFDKRTCPHYDCGFTGASIPNNSGNRNNSTATGTNLVRQPNFSGFNRPGGPWSRWISARAQSLAKTVTLKGKIKTALYIKNLSGRGPHIYGTTSQRIPVQKGQKYQITFFGYTKGYGSSYGGIVITIDPAWKIRPVRMNTKTNGWERFAGIFIAPSNYIDLRIISEDRGEVWIIAMSVRPILNRRQQPNNTGNNDQPEQRYTNNPGNTPNYQFVDTMGTKWFSAEGERNARSTWTRKGSSKKWDVVSDSGTRYKATVTLSTNRVHAVSTAISGAYKGSVSTYIGIINGNKISGQRTWKYKGKSYKGRWSASIYGAKSTNN